MLELIATTPGTTLLAYVFALGIVLLLVASALKTHREKVAARAAYADLLRSKANHPAGKGRVREPRHLDRSVYDWVNGPL